jgi:hypothetical protein
MSVDDFIHEAIARGAREGLAGLDAASAMVFLISEAEVACDKDGIDAFIHRYGAAGLSDAARAFNAIGASLIAAALRRLAVVVPPLPESLLNSVNRLITDRCGYDYEAIARAVEQLRQD